MVGAFFHQKHSFRYQDIRTENAIIIALWNGLHKLSVVIF